jgi:AraC family transcriptional regulator
VTRRSTVPSGSPRTAQVRPDVPPNRSQPDNPTAAARAKAVAQAITSMQETLDEPKELTDIARGVLMSPFYFHRVFRRLTTAPPRRFLTALRMAEAKRLLLDTTMSATDISIAVGYSSFGTFTTQFTRLVGMPPGRFRAHAVPLGDLPVAKLLERLPSRPEATAHGPRGRVSARPDGSAGVAMVGLFRSGIPQEPPLACAVAPPSGQVQLPAAGVSGYLTVLAASVSAAATVHAVLTESAAAGIFVGATRAPVGRRTVASEPEFWLHLRRKRLFDPPLLIAFPLLADSWSGTVSPVRESGGE